MAKAFKCDACGIFYEKGNNEQYQDGGRVINNVVIKVTGIEKEFDLCRQCSLKIRNALGFDKTRIR